MRRMKLPARSSAYARLIGGLVAIAVLATLARLIYYAVYWGDVVRRSLE